MNDQLLADLDPSLSLEQIQIITLVGGPLLTLLGFGVTLAFLGSFVKKLANPYRYYAPPAALSRAERARIKNEALAEAREEVQRRAAGEEHQAAKRRAKEKNRAENAPVTETTRSAFVVQPLLVLDVQDDLPSKGSMPSPLREGRDGGEAVSGQRQDAGRGQALWAPTA